MAQFNALEMQESFEPIEVTNLNGKDYAVTNIPHGVVDLMKTLGEESSAEGLVEFVSAVLGEPDKEFLRSINLTIMYRLAEYLSVEIAKQISGKDVNPTETEDDK